MKNTRMIRREWYASHGICVECGQREAEPHKRKCWECSEKKAEYNRKYNANMTPEQKEKNSIRQNSKKLMPYVDSIGGAKQCSNCHNVIH